MYGVRRGWAFTPFLFPKMGGKGAEMGNETYLGPRRESLSSCFCGDDYVVSVSLVGVCTR